MVKAYDDFIYTPVIRSEIRSLKTQKLNHYTVYLPAIDDKILLKYLHQVKETNWEVFSKHQNIPYQHGNVKVFPVDNAKFNLSLSNCSGLLTGGGFEGPAEALFLGKKVMMMPMKNQFEQECNAEAARRLGVPIIKKIDAFFIEALKKWIHNEQKIAVNFPNETDIIIENLVKKYASKPLELT